MNNKIKSLVTLISLVLIALSCQPQKTNFTISGTVPAREKLNGKTVYLVPDELIPDSTKAIASAKIEDFKFKLNGEYLADDYPLMTIYMDGYYAPVILENGDIKVDMTDVSAVGTAHNDSLHSYMKQLHDIKVALIKEFQGVVKDYRADKIDHVKYMSEYKRITNNLNFQTKEFILDYYNTQIYNVLAIKSFRDLLFKTEHTEEELSHYKDIATEEVLEHSAIKKYFQMVENRKKTAEGTMYLDFDGYNQEHKLAKLSDIISKKDYTLVNFWCKDMCFSRKQLSILRELDEIYASKGLTVLSVGLWGEAKKILHLAKHFKVTWEQLVPDNKVAEDYGIGVTEMPTALLIDSSGKIVVRDNSMNLKKIESYLAKTLK